MELEHKEKFSLREKWEWYLAQIAYEVCNAFRKKRILSVKDFLLTWKVEQEGTKTPEELEAELVEEEKRQEEKAAASKNAWLAFAGLSDNPKEKGFKTRMPPKQKKKEE